MDGKKRPNGLIVTKIEYLRWIFSPQLTGSRRLTITGDYHAVPYTNNGRQATVVSRKGLQGSARLSTSEYNLRVGRSRLRTQAGHVGTLAPKLAYV